MFSNARGVFR